jgi:type-F conjugative transfer system secretin TraK
MIKTALKWLVIMILGSGFVQSSFALQEKSVTENGEVAALVATQDLTRIAVEGDRILHVRGLDGAYELKRDAAQGAFFIRPTPDYQTKSFTLFIATEKNHNYVLHLTPKEQWGDTIVLKPHASKKCQAFTLRNSTSSPKPVITFMEHMIKGDIPPNYVIHNVTHLHYHQENQELTVKLLRLYADERHQGTLYHVTNHTRKTLLLTEKAFYRPGDRAISLSQFVVPPGDHAYLYKVRSHA